MNLTTINPEFPIYIVSKGRYNERITSRTLEAMHVNYYIIVERQERDNYAEFIDSTKILVLDPAYQKDYDTFDDIGELKSKGPGPARNFAWDHAISQGAKWHWVMDDNIDGFFRFNKNLKVPARTYAAIKCMQDFVLRYVNVSMAGPNYFKFANRKTIMQPFVINTRIYSCNFIRNNSPFRWRGRYNEDTDLSIRMLKAGWCTIQFNSILQYKMNTQKLSGGNTDAFYAKEGTLPKSQMQVAMHPDISKLVWKFGRWHHHVDYSQFKKNKLILRDDIKIPTGIDNYCMTLKHVEKGKSQNEG